MSNKHSVPDGEVLLNTVYLANMVQGRPSHIALNKNESLAIARQARLGARKAFSKAKRSLIPNPNNATNQDADDESSGDEVECTGWSGGTTHYVSSDEGPIFISDDDDEDEEEVEELSGSELEEVIQRHSEKLPAAAKQPIAELSPLSVIMGKRTNQEWRKAESTRSLRYSGQSARTKRHREKVARDKGVEDAKLRGG